MLHDRRQCSALRCPTPANRDARFAGRIEVRIGRHTNGRNRFAERHRLAQLHQSDVVIVGVRVEVAMPDDGADGAHYGRRLCGDELVVVAEDYADLRALESEQRICRLVLNLSCVRSMLVLPSHAVRSR